MMRSITVSGAPAVTAVSLEEARAHLRLIDNAEDMLLQRCIEAAVEEAQMFTGRALITQEITLTLSEWPCDRVLRLPRTPAQAAAGIKYVDADGQADMDLDEASYVVALTGDSPRLIFKASAELPAVEDENPEPIQVIYTAGYGDTPDDVPSLIKSGILFLAAHLFEQRTPEITGAPVNALQWAHERCWAGFRNFALA